MSARSKFLASLVVTAAVACSSAAALQATQPAQPTQPPTPAAAPVVAPLTLSPFQGQIGAPGGFGGSSKDPQANKLAKQFVKAEKEDQKKDFRKQLSDLLAKQFDQHVAQQQKELEKLEKQIADLKTVLKKHRTTRRPLSTAGSNN